MARDKARHPPALTPGRAPHRGRLIALRIPGWHQHYRLFCSSPGSITGITTAVRSGNMRAIGCTDAGMCRRRAGAEARWRRERQVRCGSAPATPGETGKAYDPFFIPAEARPRLRPRGHHGSLGSRLWPISSRSADGRAVLATTTPPRPSRRPRRRQADLSRYRGLQARPGEVVADGLRARVSSPTSAHLRLAIHRVVQDEGSIPEYFVWLRRRHHAANEISVASGRGLRHRLRSQPQRADRGGKLAGRDGGGLAVGSLPNDAIASPDFDRRWQAHQQILVEIIDAQPRRSCPPLRFRPRHAPGKDDRGRWHLVGRLKKRTAGPGPSVPARGIRSWPPRGVRRPCVRRLGFAIALCRLLSWLGPRPGEPGQVADGPAQDGLVGREGLAPRD
jgi:hypothetical protein